MSITESEAKMKLSERDRTELREDDVVSCDPDVVSGTPVFKGTRVPVVTLFDYLLDNQSLDEFYDDFPTVTQDHVEGVLRSARDHISQRRFSSREAPHAIRGR
jgi:uncharacterized protein (DUF433 family)